MATFSTFFPSQTRPPTKSPSFAFIAKATPHAHTRQQVLQKKKLLYWYKSTNTDAEGAHTTTAAARSAHTLHPKEKEKELTYPKDLTRRFYTGIY
jgi:hypothetical protein